jgi:hypothetical protein
LIALALLAASPTARAITIDPVNYTGRYIISGTGYPKTQFTGLQTINLPDGAYDIDTGASVCCTLNTSSYFGIVIAGGQITSVINAATNAASGAAVASGATLTFNNATITFNTGAYTGRYFIASHQGVQLQGTQALVLVPDLEYSIDDGSAITVAGVASDFLFALDAAGNVASAVSPSAAALGSGATLGFNSVSLSVNPGTYAGVYSTSADPTTGLSGTQTIVLLNGLTAYIVVGAEGDYFVPGPSGASTPTLAYSGGVTLSLSLASQTNTTPAE